MSSAPNGDHYCLKWNNFQSNIVSALCNLKFDEELVDVTLSCEGKQIKAHKVILSACSTYFRNVFKHNPCKHPIVILKDARFDDLDSLVKYIYNGQVNISQEHLSGFLKTADALQIKGLAEQPEQTEPVEETRNEARETPPSTSLHSVPPIATPPVPVTPPMTVKAPPIKVPTPPQSQFSLKRSTFTNLAQYLAGSAATPSALSPPLEPLHASVSAAKRRKTTPTKRYDPPLLPHQAPHHYSGSTSSLTASPSSPPHSHSTEGEAQLEICEESDRESGRSMEGESAKSSVVGGAYSDYGSPPDHKSSKEHMDLDPEEHPLVIEEPVIKGNASDPDSDPGYGETLDLRKRSSSREGFPTPIITPATVISQHTQHIMKGRLLEGALSSDPPKGTTSSGPSSTSTTGLANRRGSNGKEKGDPMAAAHDQGGGTHPRNRWRCMQPRLCNYCWKTFSNSFNLKQHIVNVHIQSQGVTCSLCDKVVKNKWYLRKHLVTAHGAPLKRVKGNEQPTNTKKIRTDGGKTDKQAPAPLANGMDEDKINTAAGVVRVAQC